MVNRKEKRPEKFYRYRRLPPAGGTPADESARASVIAAVCEGKFRFSVPSTFNDPFEARPAIVVMEEDGAKQAKLQKRELSRIARERIPKFRERLRHQLVNSERFERTAREMPDLVRRSVSEMRDTIGIISLSAEVERPLLWSHYADSHRGVSIVLDGAAWPWALALPVQYQAEFPRLAVPITTERRQELVDKTLLVKDRDWAYEREYRLWPPFGREYAERFRRLGIVVEGRDMVVPLTTVPGIVLGAEMPLQVREELVAVLSERRPELEILEATLARDRYALDIKKWVSRK